MVSKPPPIPRREKQNRDSRSSMASPLLSRPSARTDKIKSRLAIAIAIPTLAALILAIVFFSVLTWHPSIASPSKDRAIADHEPPSGLSSNVNAGQETRDHQNLSDQKSRGQKVQIESAEQADPGNTSDQQIENRGRQNDALNGQDSKLRDETSGVNTSQPTEVKQDANEALATTTPKPSQPENKEQASTENSAEPTTGPVGQPRSVQVRTLAAKSPTAQSTDSTDDASSPPPSSAVLPPGSNAISAGRFTAWSIPENPAPFQNYQIVVEIKFPSEEKKYDLHDLSGLLVGTDRYTQRLPFHAGITTFTPQNGNIQPISLMRPIPIIDNRVQIIIPVPGAARMVRDRITLSSKQLGERRTLTLVFDATTEAMNQGSRPATRRAGNSPRTPRSPR
jgi:hypothetical protein